MQSAPKSFLAYQPFTSSIDSNAEKSSTAAINFFDFLPEELVLSIAQYLDDRARLNFRLACKKFNVLGSDSSLIPALFKTRFPILAGFYPYEELKEELYKEAISLEKNIHSIAFKPEMTVFHKNITFGGIRSLAYSEGVLFSKHNLYPDRDIIAWDLNGKEVNRFKTKDPSGYIGITKNYIVSSNQCYNIIERISKSDKKSIEWKHPEGSFLHFKVIGESIFVSSQKGFFEIDAESGFEREYLGKFFKIFFANRDQILGTICSSFISWDRETQQIKEEFPIDKDSYNHNFSLGLTVEAYHHDNGQIFLNGGRGGLAIYDLRQRKMISMTTVHQAGISGIVFYNNEIVTASLDKKFKIWDVRCLTSFNDPKPIRCFEIGSYINTLCSQGSSLFIGSRTIYKYDFLKEELNGMEEVF